ncbi:MAG: TIGR03936 family radical SAM-associated protein [Phycisphaerae bacterium]|nr:TIGR03936 family radical SAM-associated protein [Phycisphaerae bacterium]
MTNYELRIEVSALRPRLLYLNGNIQTQTLIVKFKIEGTLRFLSHRETSTMLQRALVRQGIPLHYSEGFNPRPRMSLPLPRSVGVGSDDEVLCALVDLGADYDLDAIGEGLCRQLPEHCVVTEVSVRQKKVTLQPRSAVYVFSLKPSAFTENFRACFQTLEKASGGKTPIVVNRQSGKKLSRQVDVSPYVDSLKIEDETVMVNCAITQGGSIRIEEIMQQLGISVEDLSAPVKRASVDWSDC